jgi:hypothetical protein
MTVGRMCFSRYVGHDSYLAPCSDLATSRSINMEEALKGQRSVVVGLLLVILAVLDLLEVFEVFELRSNVVGIQFRSWSKLNVTLVAAPHSCRRSRELRDNKHGQEQENPEVRHERDLLLGVAILVQHMAKAGEAVIEAADDRRRHYPTGRCEAREGERTHCEIAETDLAHDRMRPRIIELEYFACGERGLHGLPDPGDEQAHAAGPECEPSTGEPHEIIFAAEQRLGEYASRGEDQEEEQDGEKIHVLWVFRWDLCGG